MPRGEMQTQECTHESEQLWHTHTCTKTHTFTRRKLQRCIGAGLASWSLNLLPLAFCRTGSSSHPHNPRLFIQSIHLIGCNSFQLNALQQPGSESMNPLSTSFSWQLSRVWNFKWKQYFCKVTHIRITSFIFDVINVKCQYLKLIMQNECRERFISDAQLPSPD